MKITNKAQLEKFIATTEFNGYTDYFFNNYELVEKLEDEGLVVIGNNEIFVNNEEGEALTVAGHFTIEQEVTWDEEEDEVDYYGDEVRFVSDDELQSIVEAVAKRLD